MSQRAFVQSDCQGQSEPPVSGVLQRECSKSRKKSILQHIKPGNAALSLPVVPERQNSPAANAATPIHPEPCFSYDFSRIQVHSRSPARIQAKLAVNTPGDSYEQEADRIADKVMAIPRQAVRSAPLQIQRFAGESTGQTVEAPASVDRALASPGRSLPAALQHEMEGRFGYDFSKVRVHTGPAVQQSAQDVNAHAYTVGQHITFGVREFSPDTHEGRRLVAHELAHVLQQTGPWVQRDPHFTHESGVDHAEAGVIQGRAGEVSHAVSFGLQRQSLSEEEIANLQSGDIIAPGINAPAKSAEERWESFNEYYRYKPSIEEAMEAFGNWSKYVTPKEFRRFLQADPDTKEFYYRWKKHYGGKFEPAEGGETKPSGPKVPDLNAHAKSAEERWRSFLERLEKIWTMNKPHVNLGQRIEAFEMWSNYVTPEEFRHFVQADFNIKELYYHWKELINSGFGGKSSAEKLALVEGGHNIVRTDVGPKLSRVADDPFYRESAIHPDSTKFFKDMPQWQKDRLNEIKKTFSSMSPGSHLSESKFSEIQPTGGVGCHIDPYKADKRQSKCPAGHHKTQDKATLIASEYLKGLQDPEYLTQVEKSKREERTKLDRLNQAYWHWNRTKEYIHRDEFSPYEIERDNIESVRTRWDIHNSPDPNNLEKATFDEYFFRSKDEYEEEKKRRHDEYLERRKECRESYWRSMKVKKCEERVGREYYPVRAQLREESLMWTYREQEMGMTAATDQGFVAATIFYVTHEHLRWSTERSASAARIAGTLTDLLGAKFQKSLAQRQSGGGSSVPPPMSQPSAQVTPKPRSQPMPRPDPWGTVPGQGLDLISTTPSTQASKQVPATSGKNPVPLGGSQSSTGYSRTAPMSEEEIASAAGRTRRPVGAINRGKGASPFSAKGPAKPQTLEPMVKQKPKVKPETKQSTEVSQTLQAAENAKRSEVEIEKRLDEIKQLRDKIDANIKELDEKILDADKRTTQAGEKGTAAKGEERKRLFDKQRRNADTKYRLQNERTQLRSLKSRLNAEEIRLLRGTEPTTWQEAEQALRQEFGGQKKKVSTATPKSDLSDREIDCLTPDGVSRESKFGPSKWNKEIQKEIDKDIALQDLPVHDSRKITSTEWHFFRNSNGIGPDPRLLRALEKAGFKRQLGKYSDRIVFVR